MSDTEARLDRFERRQHRIHSLVVVVALGVGLVLLATVLVPLAVALFGPLTGPGAFFVLGITVALLGVVTLVVATARGG